MSRKSKFSYEIKLKAIKKYLNAIPGIDGNYEIKVKFLETKKES